MVLLALVLLGAAPELSAEANRRTDVLISQHYNLTHGFAFDAKPEKNVVTLEFFVPEEPGEHTFSVWGEVNEGSLAVRIVGPDGRIRSMWSGRSGDSTFTSPVAAGKYVLELERSAGSSGRALFGVKGPVVRGCDLEPGALHAASTAKGFSWPYLLYVPTKVKKPVEGQRLLVAPNNTGFSTADPKLLEMSASCELRRQKGLADRLGTPLLIPLFPRPPTAEGEAQLYLHALSRSSLETKVEPYRRVDLQLIAMIDDARAGTELAPEVLAWGFSASASFVARFAVLHPERVAAVVSISPGGWPIAPVANSGADKLNYPVGVADLEALTGSPVDSKALGRVAWFFGLGSKDENDSVGNRDSFSEGDEALISRRFGKTPVTRWKRAGQLYEGLNASFRLYPRVAHQVSSEMAEDAAVFLEKVR